MLQLNTNWPKKIITPNGLNLFKKKESFYKTNYFFY